MNIRKPLPTIEQLQDQNLRDGAELYADEQGASAEQSAAFEEFASNHGSNYADIDGYDYAQMWIAFKGK